MGGDIATAVEEVRAIGLPVISLNMAGSVRRRRPRGQRSGAGRCHGGDGRGRYGEVRSDASAQTAILKLEHPTTDPRRRVPPCYELRRMPAVVVVIAFFSWGEPVALGQTRPANIVADDMGYADIGVHGSKDIPTPNIDALAAWSPLHRCVCHRSVLQSDARRTDRRYPQRFGHEFNLGRWATGLPLSETTLADR